MVRAVFLGPPGAGKGTQAARQAGRLSVPHIATGDLFRAAVAEGTDVGLRAKTYMSAGRLVPDDVVNDLVAWRLGKPDSRESFLFDGFPRTLPQAAALDETLRARGAELDFVVCFEIGDEELVERAAARLVCRSCSATYNARSAAPKTAGICDRCGQPLYRRDDDAPEVVRKRLHVYHEQTEPVISHYRERSLIRPIAADRPIDVVARELDKLFPRPKPSGRGVQEETPTGTVPKSE